jgi:CubicO group peptidase (beta-lactamase class C family)
MAQPDTGQVDALFAEWDRSDSPGCALGVIQQGELTYARGYGMANLDLGVALTPASVCHVASVSKQFTAIAIELLADDGLLTLDEDVRAYVPELPEFGQPITLRHLVNHTSGLRDQYALFRLAGWRDDDVQAFEDVLEFAFQHRRLNFVPGSEYSYCNTSYTLLALVVERVSGQRLRAFVQARLLEPLDMSHSHIHDDVTEIVPGRASAYEPREDREGRTVDGFQVSNSTVEAFGAICLYTSVEDLARWVRNFGQRRVAPAALERAMTPGALNDGTALRYGGGLALSEYRGLRTVGHGGVDAGYRSEVLWFPEVDFGVVVLANLSTIKPGALARRVADLYLPERLGPDEFLDAPAAQLPVETLARYAGLYRDERTGLTRRVKLEDGKLTVNSGFGERLELTPIAEDRFRLGDPPFEAHVAPGPAGTMHYRERTSDGRVGDFTAATPAEPGVERLADYAGAYVCPELDVRYTLAVRDGALTLLRRKAKAVTLEPTVTDAFVAEQRDIVFLRDGRGAVSGFEVFAERIRNLRFDFDVERERER